MGTVATIAERHHLLRAPTHWFKDYSTVTHSIICQTHNRQPETETEMNMSARYHFPHFLVLSSMAQLREDHGLNKQQNTAPSTG